MKYKVVCLTSRFACFVGSGKECREWISAEKAAGARNVYRIQVF